MDALKTLFQIIAVVIVFIVTYYFVYWVPLAFVPNFGLWFIPVFISLLCAALVSTYAWKLLASVQTSLFSHVMLGAILLGSLGFFGGFFGPILFAPQANQGPLLGIFITGPAGFLLGGIAGLVYWIFQSKRRKES